MRWPPFQRGKSWLAEASQPHQLLYSESGYWNLFSWEDRKIPSRTHKIAVSYRVTTHEMGCCSSLLSRSQILTVCRVVWASVCTHLQGHQLCSQIQESGTSCVTSEVPSEALWSNSSSKRPHFLKMHLLCFRWLITLVTLLSFNDST